MLCLLRRARIAASPLLSSPTTPSRLLHSTPLALQRPMPSRPKPPPDSEIEESYLKGSGPGGQKINKTNSAVQLKHIPTGIVVKSQATRSRAQNRKHAREILAQRLDDLWNGEESRAGIVGTVKKKRADSKAKKSRRKYRKLDEERQAAAAQGGEAGRGDGIARDAAGDGIDDSRAMPAEKQEESRSESLQANDDASPKQPTDTTNG